MNLLELKKISKAYTSNIGEFKILDNVNLSLQNKENIFCLDHQAVVNQLY
jgi:ABC-type lipoprotein export system ATPase subunit